MHLFVYGTLKRNFCRHFVLKNERFIGTISTAPRYRMYNVGTYPALIEVEQKGRSIQGEIWDVRESSLAKLDEVEGTDEGLYVRRMIELAVPLAEPVQAYFYLLSVENCEDCGVSWDLQTELGPQGN